MRLKQKVYYNAEKKEREKKLKYNLILIKLLHLLK